MTIVDELVNDLQKRNTLLDTLDRYYRGEQPIAFVPPEVLAATGNRLATLIINWPRVIADTIEERLDVEGFVVGGADQTDADLWNEIWQPNDCDEQSQFTHIDSLIHGIAYVSVGAFDDGEPRIEAETAHEVICRYEPGTRQVSAALKRWEDDDKRAHVRLYLPNATLFFDSEPNRDVTFTDEVPHKLGVVPIVPFVNRPRAGSRHGCSELADVMRLADAVNKLATDMLVTSEFHAMPRRWATGIELQRGQGQQERTQAEVKRYWDSATAGKTWLAGSGVTFGQFAAADLANFTNAIVMLTGQIAAVAGLPPHYLGINTENPASADAIRSAEASLVARAKRKQRTLGGSWEQVMRLAEAVRRDIGVAELGPEWRSLQTVWRDPATPTVAQTVDAVVKLRQTDVITNAQALEDLGYTPQQIEREARRRTEAATSTATADVTARLALADQLQREQGLSQAAAFAAVGLLQAAQQMSPTGATPAQ